MHIVCPHCNFSKDIPESAIPAGLGQVVCPKCKQTFPLAVVGGTTSSFAPATASPVQVESDGNYAGFWIRGAALFIDGIAVGIIQLTAAFLLGMILLSGGMNEERMLMMQIMIQLFSFCLSLVYYVFFTGYCGQTPGKMAMRVKVVRITGEEINYGTALLRETLGKFISMIIFGIGYLMAAFDERKQGLHDKIAKTVVVRI